MWLAEKEGTQEAIFDALHHIRRAQDERKPIGMVKMDIRKFFDTIDREKLWIKMEELGFEGRLMQWIKAHMDGMGYFVKVKDARTAPKTHEIGLPQGSILSPILAAIHTEGAPDVIMQKHAWMTTNSMERTNTRPRVFATQFADDNSVVIAGPDEETIDREKVSVIKRFTLWARLMSLQFDLASGKTEHMTIHSLMHMSASNPST